MRKREWVESFMQDLRYVLRSLRRSPTFVISATLTLRAGTRRQRGAVLDTRPAVPEGADGSRRARASCPAVLGLHESSQGRAGCSAAFPARLDGRRGCVADGRRHRGLPVANDPLGSRRQRAARRGELGGGRPLRDTWRSHRRGPQLRARRGTSRGICTCRGRFKRAGAAPLRRRTRRDRQAVRSWRSPVHHHRSRRRGISWYRARARSTRGCR